MHLGFCKIWFGRITAVSRSQNFTVVSADCEIDVPNSMTLRTGGKWPYQHEITPHGQDTRKTLFSFFMVKRPTGHSVLTKSRICYFHVADV